MVLLGTAAFNGTVVLRYRIHLQSRNLASGTINVKLGCGTAFGERSCRCRFAQPRSRRRHPTRKSRQETWPRLGNGLSAKEARDLWQSADAETLKGKRYRAIITVLLGVGSDGESWPT
jgi:hypothetical protein